MMRSARLCVYNPTAAATLLEPFQSLRGLNVLGESTTWKMLEAWLREGKVDLVAVDLDAPDSVEIVERICRASPTCKVIGIGNAADSRKLIRANRAGCAQFVTKPANAEDVRRAIEQILARGHAAQSAHKQICVIGASGGAGTTTIACNLGIELAKLTGSRCAVIDLNLELGDVGVAFNAKSESTLADVCACGAEIDHRLLEASFQALPGNVFIMHGPDEAGLADAITPEGLETTLALAREMFPFVVIDLPRTFNPLNAAAMNGADHVLIVTELAVAGIHNATRVCEQLCRMGVPEERVGVVVNRHRAKHGSIDPQIVRDHFGKDLFGVVPNDYLRVKTALDLGEPVSTDECDSPIRSALREMALKIAGGLVASDGAPSSTGDSGRTFVASHTDTGISPTDSDSRGIARHVISAARRLVKWSGRRESPPDETESNGDLQPQKQRETADTQLGELRGRVETLAHESEARARQVAELTGDLESTRRELVAQRRLLEEGIRRRGDLEARLEAVAADRDATSRERCSTRTDIPSLNEQIRQLQKLVGEGQERQNLGQPPERLGEPVIEQRSDGALGG